MVFLNVKELLEKKGKSKYWLFNKMNTYMPISYTNFNNMIENRTGSIKYDNIEKLCIILDCEIQDLLKRDNSKDVNVKNVEVNTVDVKTTETKKVNVKKS